MKKQVLLAGTVALCLISSFSHSQTGTNAGKASKRVVAPSEDFLMSLELAAVNATLKIEVRGLNKKTSTGFSFKGLTNCPALNLSLAHLEETGKCLEFRTGESKPLRIPIVVINAAPPKAHEDIIDEGAQRVRADKKDWGELDIWKGSRKKNVYYFFLRPDDKDQMVRLGPLPESLQKAFNIQMDLELW